MGGGGSGGFINEVASGGMRLKVRVRISRSFFLYAGHKGVLRWVEEVQMRISTEMTVLQREFQQICSVSIEQKKT